MRHIFYFLILLIEVSLIYGIYYAVNNKHGEVAFWYGVLTVPITVCLITFYNDNYTEQK